MHAPVILQEQVSDSCSPSVQNGDGYTHRNSARMTADGCAQASEKEIGSLQGRLEATEQNQRNIMAFLTKAMQEPGFLQQVLGSNPGPQRLTDGETAGEPRHSICGG